MVLHFITAPLPGYEKVHDQMEDEFVVTGIHVILKLVRAGLPKGVLLGLDFAEVFS